MHSGAPAAMHTTSNILRADAPVFTPGRNEHSVSYFYQGSTCVGQQPLSYGYIHYLQYAPSGNYSGDYSGYDAYQTLNDNNNNGLYMDSNWTTNYPVPFTPGHAVNANYIHPYDSNAAHQQYIQQVRLNQKHYGQRAPGEPPMCSGEGMPAKKFGQKGKKGILGKAERAQRRQMARGDKGEAEGKAGN